MLPKPKPGRVHAYLCHLSYFHLLVFPKPQSLRYSSSTSQTSYCWLLNPGRHSKKKKFPQTVSPSFHEHEPSCFWLLKSSNVLIVSWGNCWVFMTQKDEKALLVSGLGLLRTFGEGNVTPPLFRCHADITFCFQSLSMSTLASTFSSVRRSIFRVSVLGN